ncbi:S-layer homology domain-containing protein [Lysinibacillus sp. RC79]|uniref:S-layer homology domain-containing protein n=1 Tax=Lysinibacillus sp. RC79 TaxID=3156296 RepID=UPI003515BFE8
MDKTKVQKVNKALIATVFATSGIAVVVPPQNAAAATSPFTDIDQYSSHYDNILKLYSQGAISGYADKTFRPNQNVTRGQAAKMLATVLDLDLKNVQDPYFKDVPKSSEYYKYIAALQNAGIMAGYSNGTFMPNEVITRGQLAKILALGFKFEVASNYNHSFQDVTSQTSNAIYIQTLVDLKITEGTTPVTFSPYNAVTRGQISSFIVRSQEKKGNATSFKITGVEDDNVYINGEPYSVPESLSHIFNEDNAPVLKGALIEGDLSGKTIRSVSKLTLNASGTSSRFLEFDGDHGSFGATIVVNGNYIEFSNVTLTGTMLVNETVRPPLQLGVSYYKPSSLGPIASINTAFINWSNPDNPNDEGSSSSNNGPTTDLQNWTDQNSDKNPDKNKPFENWSKDKVTMKNVEKHIEFYNSTVSRLVVSQSGTKIETNTKLPRVDIIGTVREFEIQGNIGTLNLDTETKLTIYGDGNIDWINYNSYTDLELYIDGRVGTLYVDNVYGWVDLGDYTYVDKVIIPKGESPNNIFDDFLEDKDNIGTITDPDGKPVDKDDLENQKPADKTKPLIDITNVNVLSGSEIQVDFTSDKVGTYYYIVREKGADAPTKKEMVNRISTDNVASGTGAAVLNKNTFKVTKLGEKKEYVIYVMVVDGANNVSDIKSQEFKMKDTIAPVVTFKSVKPLPGGKRAEVTFNSTKSGEYFYLVRKKSNATPPTAEEIISKPTNKGKVTGNTAAELTKTILLENLEAKTDYDFFIVVRDDSGNISKVASTLISTLELDEINPFVEKTKLEPAAGKENQFYIYLNEALDPESARNVNNYDLSGTVIVNTTGQKKIKPSAVEYKEGDKKVLLTIPSETGFVYGDTLRATVLPGVKDLAGNEFENTNTVEPGKNVRNYAEYVHEKHVPPNILELNVIGKPDQDEKYKRAEVEFKPNKAGTYYYMVLPDTVEDNGETKTFEQYLKDKGITERDFYNEFATESSLKSGYFQIGGKDIYIEIGSGPADLEADTKKFPIVIDKDKLNPFISYSVHMILKDRGGELSKIASKAIFGDSRAPLVTEIAVKSGTTKGYDDTKAIVSFSTDETTKLHYWFVPKKNADGTDNPDAKLTINTAAERKTLEDKLKSSPSVTKSGKGTSGTLDMTGVTLTPHTEYVVYLGAQDTYGNFTVYKAKDGIHDESNDGWMKQDFYSDGTPPRFEMTVGKEKKRNIVYRNPDDTFTISFSEAIMRDEKGDSSIKDLSLLTITDDADQDITSQYQFVKYTKGKATTEESQLIIKPTASGTADKTFTVKMKDDIARDYIISGYEGNKFDLADFGKYVYPGSIKNRIDDAVVTGTNIGTDDVPASKTMRAIVYIDADLSVDQRYYYAVTGGATTIDPQLVIDLVKDPKTPNNTILAYGSDKLVAQSPANKQFTLNLTAPPAVDPKYTPVFTKNNNFFIFTVDQYGNIVWANDTNNPNNTYFKLGSNIKP